MERQLIDILLPSVSGCISISDVCLLFGTNTPGYRSSRLIWIEVCGLTQDWNPVFTNCFLPGKAVYRVCLWSRIPSRLIARCNEVGLGAVDTITLECHVIKDSLSSNCYSGKTVPFNYKYLAVIGEFRNKKRVIPLDMSIVLWAAKHGPANKCHELWPYEFCCNFKEQGSSWRQYSLTQSRHSPVFMEPEGSLLLSRAQYQTLFWSNRTCSAIPNPIFTLTILILSPVYI